MGHYFLETQYFVLFLPSSFFKNLGQVEFTLVCGKKGVKIGNWFVSLAVIRLYILVVQEDLTYFLTVTLCYNIKWAKTYLTYSIRRDLFTE